MENLIHNLVEKVFDRQEVFDRIHNETEEEFLKFHPFITVSRDPGSGGRPIAKIVSEKLNFTFYNQKLIDEIAKSAKARLDIMEDVDERQRTLMEDVVHNVLNPEYISERRYIKHLCKVVLKLAQNGGVVLLGRGTNFITPNSMGLHVRITAPYRVCVARAVKYEKMSYSKARQVIRKVAAERAGFVKQYFNKDIGNPKYYDLTINTTYLSLEDAADIIVAAFKRKFA